MMSQVKNSCLLTDVGYRKLISERRPQTTEGEREWLFDSDEWPSGNVAPEDLGTPLSHTRMTSRGNNLCLIGLTPVWCWTIASIFTFQGFGVH